jgi:acyl carrier protein
MSCQDQIHAFVVENFFVPEEAALDENTSLITGGIVDSTGVLELVDFVEERFRVRIEDHEMLPENLDSIARIAKLVQGKLERSPDAIAVTS